MRLVIAVLGVEVLRIDLGHPADEPGDDSHELVATSRHGGDFQIGFGPSRPYWDNSGTTAAPPVA